MGVLNVSETDAQPAWVERKPIDQDWYIGIGSAEKIPGSSLHIDQARDQALARIASSIAVSIKAETTHHAMQQAGVYEEVFTAMITSFAKANLEGYEKVDVWEDDKQYWVYYRLSVKEYSELLEKRKQSAVLQATAYLDFANKALSENHVSRALNNLLQAAYQIRHYRGLGLPFPGGEEGFVDVEIYLKIQDILAGMHVNLNPSLIRTGLYQIPPDTIKVTLKYFGEDREQHVLNNIPLKASSPDPGNDSVHLDNTDSKGKSFFFIPRMQYVGRKHIEVSPDLLRLAGFGSEEGGTLLTGIHVPSGRLFIHVEPPRVFLETNELNINKQLSHTVSDGRIRSYLAAGEWLITDDPNKADFLIRINASARKGVERQGVHTAFASGSVSMYRTKSNDEVFSMPLQQVNGAGTNFENAGIQALERLSEQVLEAFQSMLPIN